MSKLVRWLPAIAIVLLIYHFSTIPDLHLVSESHIPAWLKPYIEKYTFRIGNSGYFSYMLSLHPDFILHKIGHIVAFGTLGVSLYFAVSSLPWAVVLTAVAAFADEFHQYFVPGRSSRLGDVILDTLAGLLFILLVRAIQHCRNKR